GIKVIIIGIIPTKKKNRLLTKRVFFISDRLQKKGSVIAIKNLPNPNSNPANMGYKPTLYVKKIIKKVTISTKAHPPKMSP
ncbi:hypothetical protein, partial [Francisella tularensis]|uniref:hypothetical protein n=1 Tax=Francisella tularensis TaxID=263 RepID=UPI002381C7B3